MKKIAVCLLALLLMLPTGGTRGEERRSLPARYLTDCPEHGEIHSLLFQGERELLVWTPYGYDAGEKYEVVFLMHGDLDDINGWFRQPHAVAGGKTTGRNILDWMAYEQACRPFLAVAIDNNENTYGAQILEDLPNALIFVAGRFSTYAAEGSAEAVIEAREHFTVGGLSRGCIYAYSVLENEPEYAANYLCLSCGGRRDALEAALKNTPYGLSRYFAGIGARDETFYSRTKWTYEGVKPFAGQAEMAVYAYGHDWSTWFNGLYDGLRFLLPLEEDAGPEGEIF